MRLYSTTTSERASKGQGGNEFIEMIINDEQGKNLVALSAKVIENEIYVEFLNYSTGEKNIYSFDLPQTKGKRQKGGKF